MLAEDVDTGEFEVDEMEEREALGMAMPILQWIGGEWVGADDAVARFLTWSPAADGPTFWVQDGHLFWTRESAARAARQRTTEARRERRTARRRARRARRSGRSDDPSMPERNDEVL